METDTDSLKFSYKIHKIDIIHKQFWKNSEKNTSLYNIYGIFVNYV